MKKILTILVIAIILPGCGLKNLIFEDSELLPSKFINNEQENEKIIVFVHGVTGGVKSTWINEETNIYWPDVIKKEVVESNEPFKGFDVFAVSYYSPFVKSGPNIFQLANKLNEELIENGIYPENEQEKVKYKEVIFVAHSMGNLVVRTAMIIGLNKQDDVANTENYPEISLLLSIAAPSEGSSLAGLGEFLSDNIQFQEMVKIEGNSFLQLLNTVWDGEGFDTEIACAYEKNKFLGVKIVKNKSATAVCTRKHPQGFSENHISIVKPKNKEDKIHQWLRSQIEQPKTNKGWELERWAENKIIIAGKDYLESNIHLAMMALAIEKEAPEIQVIREYAGGDGQNLFSDLQHGTIDLYSEYSGSVLFAYLRENPLEFKKYKSIEQEKKAHSPEEINKRLARNINTVNMTYYSQFGYHSPFVLLMLREKAEELGILKNNKVKMSDIVEKNISDKLFLKAGTGFFYRSDGYPGLLKAYGKKGKDWKGFFKKEYVKHENVYKILRKSSRNNEANRTAMVIVGYGTDYELNGGLKNDIVIIEDDKQFFPYHFPGPLARRYLLKKFPKITPALESLKNILNTTEMADLLKEGDKIWRKHDDKTEIGPDIEKMVRNFLEKKGKI